MEAIVDEVLPKDQLLNSLNRSASKAGFILAFYERFMASSEEIHEKFARPMCAPFDRH